MFLDRKRSSRTKLETSVFSYAQRAELLKGIFDSDDYESFVLELTFPKDTSVAGWSIRLGLEQALYLMTYKKAMPILFVDRDGRFHSNSSHGLGWCSSECDRLLAETFIYVGGELDAIYDTGSESEKRGYGSTRPKWDRT